MRLLTVLAVTVCAARAQLIVDEAATRALLRNQATVVSLALQNRQSQPLALRIELEWLAPEDTRLRQASLPYTAPPGASQVEAALPLDEHYDPLLCRLRYAVSPDVQNLTAFTPVRGIVAFPQIAPYAFRLSAIGLGGALAGRPYEFRIFAAHPLSGRPAPGVAVKLDEASAVTDAEGTAALQVTPGSDDWEDLTIDARLGDLVQSIEAPSPDLPQNQVRIYTDKPLYQPGQTLHARFLALGGDGRARAGANYEMSIRDDADIVLARTHVTTSRFGIASMDWDIPPSAEAGEYTLQVKEGDSNWKRSVEVRLYELPSFRVTVQPDRSFYLPGQSATLDIHAAYLFGKPVPGGKLRITEADDEEALRTGTLDAAGNFRTELPLDPEDELERARFIDRHFVAYVTDPGTNRTEQRAFDVRLSRDPLHVYVLERQRSTLGLLLYVSTYTPDGSPAVAGVTVEAADRTIGTGRTNRYGLARIEIPDRSGDLVVRATTPAGSAKESIHIYSAPAAVRIETDRSLYRQGQPVRCRIRSSERTLRGTLLAWNTEGRVLYSRVLELVHGVAEAVLPYDPHFGREVAIAFVSPLGGEYQARRSVVFPGAGELRIEVNSSRDTYRPGEQASLSFRATDSAGAPLKSALGIAVVDQAVLERAATDTSGPRLRWFEESSREERIGGYSQIDLLDIGPAQIDADLQLVAEALLGDVPIHGQIPDFANAERSAYENAARKNLTAVQTQLDSHYQSTLDYPRDDASLARAAGVAFGQALDPWMDPYRARFETRGKLDILSFVSAGPDKKFDTADDIVALEVAREWLFPIDALIRKALAPLTDYPATTGEFEKILAAAGLQFDALRDPWQNPLRVQIHDSYVSRIIEILSPGPDHVAGTDDDFAVTSYYGTYFLGMTERIRRVLDAAPAFPTDRGHLAALLAPTGVDIDALRDPWGLPYEFVFNTRERFADDIQVYTYADYGGVAEVRKKVTPIKRQTLSVWIQSRGGRGNGDFPVAHFDREIVEAPVPKNGAPLTVLPVGNVAGKGTIRGVVTDESHAGAVNAEVILNDAYRTTTDLQGAYSFAGITPGKCTVQFSAPGFRKAVIGGIPAEADRVTRVDAVLQVAPVAQQVTVAAPSPLLNTENAQTAQVRAVPREAATFTPHVREYFPETLLWNPELITDSTGRATLTFKLADSITTWHAAVIASTLDGRVAESAVDFKAFQPFFVDLDPPKILTVGDEVTLPAPVRNYLATPQIVAVETTAAPALRILEGARQGPKVGSNSSANAVVRLRAEAANPAAKLRVTASGNQAADAIEKPVAIHPDGESVARSVTELLESGRTLRIDMPATIIAGSLHGEVRIYPSVLAHIVESMEALLHKPTGCAEQTISSSYPNLLFLRAAARSGLRDDSLEARARRNLESGYQRLLGFRNGRGGFGYWSAAAPDAALTAYAIAFLEDAAGLIAVDEDVLERARHWLSLQTLANPAVRSLALRALAHAGSRYEAAVAAQLGEIARGATLDDPYAIAVFVLAALDAGKPALARPAIDRLRAMVHEEQGMAWWHLQSNSPFYGWGRAGRIEATALALSALERWQKRNGPDAEVQRLIGRGVAFLLRNKGADGTWLTTQATIRVFDALLEAVAAPQSQAAYSAGIAVNGVSAAIVQVDSARALRGPVTVDVSRLLKPGAANEVMISAPAGHAASQVEFAAGWYEPWQGPRTSPDLALQVKYSDVEAAVNQPIRCDVTVSRTAFRGYGMMIAEIGLPPGAEVDRGTLADAGVDSYEVAPDHVTFYVWPHADDSMFHFTFRPRYPMRARTAASELYDYYNPEARAVVPPVTLTVR